MPSTAGMMWGSKDVLFGRHPIHETLIANRRRVRQIYIAEGVARKGIVDQILQRAESTHVPVEFVNAISSIRSMSNIKASSRMLILILMLISQKSSKNYKLLMKTVWFLYWIPFKIHKIWELCYEQRRLLVYMALCYLRKEVWASHLP